MNEQPKVLKDFKIYLTSTGGIATKYLIEQLKNQRIIKEESSLSFYSTEKNAFIYALTVPLPTEEIPASSQIEARFILKDQVL